MILKNVLVIFIFSLCVGQEKDKAIKLSGHAQGTTWSITYYHADTAVTQVEIDSIFMSIDSSLSLYKPYSRIVSFNNNTKRVKLDEHLRNIINASLIATNETKGLSDITIGPLTERWGFTARQSNDIPSRQEIERLCKCVGSKYLYIRNDSLIKRKPCVKLDANGIAQGYTVDVLSSYLTNKNINNFIVEVGGEVAVSGQKPGNSFFKVGIESPSGDDINNLPMQKVVQLKSGAITTSGNYRKFYESKGKKYSHIIDPRTGYSVQNNIISVTVFAKNATTADAYDNALMLMGVNNALKFVEARPEIAAFIIYKNEDGKIKDTASSRFPFAN